MNKPGSEWQTLMDDTWSEFMTGIKARNTQNREANMFRIKDSLYTEEEVSEWCSTPTSRRGARILWQPTPAKKVIQRIVDSICENKVQQFGAADSDERGAGGDGRAHRGGSRHQGHRGG